MSTNAYLPCFVCNKVLPNAFIESDNQPYGGTEFRTYGHYGSTFWDSFDGEELVLNICDECLTERKDRLGQQKSYLPVKVKGLGPVGRYDVDRPMVPYTGNPDDDVMWIDPEDIGVVSKVIWSRDAEDLKAYALREDSDA